MSANIELSDDDIDIFIRNINHPSQDVVEVRERFLTEEVKVDYDALSERRKNVRIQRHR